MRVLALVLVLAAVLTSISTCASASAGTSTRNCDPPSIQWHDVEVSTIRAVGGSRVGGVD